MSRSIFFSYFFIFFSNYRENMLYLLYRKESCVMARTELTPQDIEYKKIISSKLNSLLNSANKKQIDITRQTGIPASTLTGYFKGTRLPAPKNVAKLASFFNVPDYEIDPRFKKNVDENDLDGRLEKMLDSARSFEGKPITPNDRELLKDWLKLYYKSKEEN